MVIDQCPHCKRDMRGPKIPEEYLYAYRPDEPAYYSRIIGVEIRGIYDGVAYWQCPDCGWAWHRFDETDGRWRKIDPWVKEIQDLFTSPSQPGAGVDGRTVADSVPESGGSRDTA